MTLKHFYLGEYTVSIYSMDDTPYVLLEDELYHKIRLARELTQAETEWWRDIGKLDYKALFDESGSIVKSGAPLAPSIWSLFDNNGTDTGRRFSVLNDEGIPMGQKDELAYFTKLLARAKKHDSQMFAILWHEVLLYDVLTDIR